MAPPSRTSAPRLGELDGLRGLAVAAVMCCHFTDIAAPVTGADRILLALAGSGWIGVDLFFVLSGFLITGILVDAKGSEDFLRTFYIRRFWRIFPIYYLLLTVLLLTSPLHPVFSLEGSEYRAPGLFFYGANYMTEAGGWPSRPLIHLWSLSVEEHFYIFWPVLVAMLSLRRLAAATVVLLLAVPLLRALLLAAGASGTSIYVPTHTRIDTLLFGALLAIVLRLYPGGARRPVAGAAVAFVAAGLAAAWLAGPRGVVWQGWMPFQLTWGFSLLAAGFTGLLVATLGLAESNPYRRMLRCRPLVRIGKLSYGIYLFHVPIDAWARNLGLHPARHATPDSPIWPELSFYVLGIGAVVYLLAELSWRYVESPLLEIKERWRYRPASPPDPGGAER